MNPISWLRVGTYALIGVLIGALAMMTNLYLGKRDELTAYQAQVNALAKQASDKAAEIKRLHEETLTKVRKDYEDRVPEIRDAAVTAYRASLRLRIQPKPSGSGVPPASPGIKVDDGAGKECLLDEEFIRDAAEDAAKVEAWRQWCYSNHCPVE